MDWHGLTILAPLTRGGNLPFRRLCVTLGARVTVSEMAYSRQVTRGSGTELALLRKHADEPCFGVQLAASTPEDAVRAGSLAVERGAAFVDVNAGCPIHDVVRRGMGATLLRRPAALARIAEAMVKALPVPVTVKIRLGWCEAEKNAPELAQRLEEVGIAALVVHGRTREQRYSRSADWSFVARLVQERRIPIIGNGDILTHYEARWRQQESGCASVMIGRGALIKPWLFDEIARGQEWLPSAEERVGVYLRLVGFMKEHLGADARGKKKSMYFLPWHLGFLCRYRPLPQAQFEAAAREHPLMQTRSADTEAVEPLEALLRDSREATHAAIAEILWEGDAAEAVIARLRDLAVTVEPSAETSSEIATAHG